MWWPASAQSLLMKSGSSRAIALKTGLPIFIALAYHANAMKIGKPVFKAMAKDEPDFISSDCALAGHHIAQGMQIAGTLARALQHPLSLVRLAYGL